LKRIPKQVQLIKVSSEVTRVLVKPAIRIDSFNSFHGIHFGFQKEHPERSFKLDPRGDSIGFGIFCLWDKIPGLILGIFRKQGPATLGISAWNLEEQHQTPQPLLLLSCHKCQLVVMCKSFFQKVFYNMAFEETRHGESSRNVSFQGFWTTKLSQILA
jgi:hypothetical protein